MAKYDVEMLLADIRSLLAANLNAKISAINTEKNDSIILKTVSDSAYFFQELNGKQVNHNPFVLYGEEKVEGESMAGSTSEIVTVSIIIVVEDQGEDIGDVITKRMMRYRRALKEVFEDSFQILKNGNILKVQSLPAVQFNIENSESYRAIGISLVSAIG